LPSPNGELHGFFGICSYYQRFVKGFSQLSAQLTNLMKKGAFMWIEEAHNTFDKLKEVMSICLVLALHDYTRPFMLECDAVGGGDWSNSDAT
jgi:hypothetical protein